MVDARSTRREEHVPPLAAPGEGELALMRAVLKDALHCIADDPRPGVRRRRRAQEARAWVASRDQAWPFSFENVCQWLGLDVDHLRSRLLRIDPTTSAASEQPPAEQRLTRRELEITEHVARGLTNVEVGRALGLARTTVTMHLGNVFLKLGIHSREELRHQASRLSAQHESAYR